MRTATDVVHRTSPLAVLTMRACRFQDFSLFCNSPVTARSACVARAYAISGEEEDACQRGATTRMLPILARPSARRSLTFTAIRAASGSPVVLMIGITAIV